MEYTFWTFSFKGWLISVQGMTGIKNSSLWANKTRCFRGIQSWFKDFRSHDAKANTICFSEYLILEIRYALGLNKSMNSSNFRNIPNPLIVLLACLAFHSKGRGPSCLLTLYIWAYFAFKCWRNLTSICKLSYIVFWGITFLPHARFWQTGYGQRCSVGKSYFQVTSYQA